VLGATFNYMLGYGGESLINRYVKKKDLDKASGIMNKYGWAGLFAALVLPLPGDPLTVLCGAAKMRLNEFILIVTAAKALKYYLLLEALTLVLH
jgi:membrane protein YqaA with SNARE-associated domain